MTERTASGLTYTVEGEVATITFARPEKLNPLNESILERLIDICAELRGSTEIRAVAFTGEGRAFSAGMDVMSMTQRHAQDGASATLARRVHTGKLGQQACEAIERLDQVTVASLHGYVVGGAFAIALACDFRIALNNTELWLPEVDIGVPMTWGAVPRLIALAGPSRAKEIIMTCERIDADTALAWGLVNRVVTDNALADATQQFLDAILAKPPAAIAITKHMVTAMSRTWAEHAAYADPYLLLLSQQTADAAEAMMARMQKRAPKFKGR